jgi:hypothetical protein
MVARFSGVNKKLEIEKDEFPRLWLGYEFLN